MFYQYEKEIVNRNKVDHFFDKNNFVGYILPDGTIFKCENHNVTNADTFLQMFLDVIDKDYNEKDELLNVSTNNDLLKVIVKCLKNMSHDKIHALRVYVNNNKVFLSDLLVLLFGCHLVTRLDKEILTSETDYSLFYNYLLNDFKITNIGKLIYDEEKKEYKHIYPIIRNEELYSEIKRIKEDLGKSDINLFYKTR